MAGGRSRRRRRAGRRRHAGRSALAFVRHRRDGRRSETGLLSWPGRGASREVPCSLRRQRPRDRRSQPGRAAPPRAARRSLRSLGRDGARADAGRVRGAAEGPASRRGSTPRPAAGVRRIGGRRHPSGTRERAHRGRVAVRERPDGHHRDGRRRQTRVRPMRLRRTGRLGDAAEDGRGGGHCPRQRRAPARGRRSGQDRRRQARGHRGRERERLRRHVLLLFGRGRTCMAASARG